MSLLLRHNQASGKPRRDVEQFSSFGNRCSNVKRESSRDSASVRDSQMERERILSEQRDIHDFLEKKADQAFQGECAAQTKLCAAQSPLDRREWIMRNADIALHEPGMQLQLLSMGLCQAHQLSDQTRREKNWPCDELEMRNKAFQEDIEQEVAKKLKNYEDVAVLNLKELDNLELMNFLATRPWPTRAAHPALPETALEDSVHSLEDPVHSLPYSVSPLGRPI